MNKIEGEKVADSKSHMNEEHEPRESELQAEPHMKPYVLWSDEQRTYVGSPRRTCEEEGWAAFNMDWPRGDHVEWSEPKKMVLRNWRI